MVDTISTLGLQHRASTNITNGQALLSKLSEQLTTGIVSSNLTDYTSSDAQKLLNFNGKVDEQNGFLTVINTISPRISAYDSALNGIEDTISEASSTILGMSTYNSATNSSLQSSIEGYMDQMSYYLNQKVGDRYIFSGTRYDQAPVIDAAAMTALPTPPDETAPYIATEPAVPAYDTDYHTSTTATSASALLSNALTFTALPDAAVPAQGTIAGGVTFTAAASMTGTVGNNLSVEMSAGTIGGTYKFEVYNNGVLASTYDNVPNTGGGTNDVWSNLNAQIAADPAALVSGALDWGGNLDPTTLLLPLTTNLTGGVDTQAGAAGNGMTVTLSAGSVAGTYRAVISDGTTTETYDNLANTGGGTNDVWTNLKNAIAARPSVLVSTTQQGMGNLDPSTLTLPTTLTLANGKDAEADARGDSYPEAYVEDAVKIDTTKTLTYGVSSDDIGFQQVIMGLRFAYAATKDPDNYKTLMETAQDLLSQGLANVRATHTTLSSASSTLSKTKTTITSNISNLKDQVDNIENVDINEVGVKITVLQAQLEAAYAATAKMAKLSILDYL